MPTLAPDRHQWTFVIPQPTELMMSAVAEDMKKRGIKSPNKADALGLTFAGGDIKVELRRSVTSSNYDPFKVGTDDFERHIRQVQSGTEYTPF